MLVCPVIDAAAQRGHAGKLGKTGGPRVSGMSGYRVSGDAD
jgi:hypothetical protein